MKLILQIFLGAALGFLLITWWALESGGVAVIETRADDGSLRSTHVWFVEPDGELWVEAGTPENGWYLDVLRDPALSFSADRRSGRYLAERVSGDNTDRTDDTDDTANTANTGGASGAHARVRSLLREKYGFRDFWISLIFETSNSIAMRLIPVEGRAQSQSTAADPASADPP